MMSRRHFFTAVGSASILGCSSSPQAVVTRSDRQRLEAEAAERASHLQMLEKYRVPVDAQRSSAVQVEEILAVAPEMKSRLRQTVRLHPRFSDPPAAASSHFGGRFLWPESEPWPVCGHYRVPLVPVVQIRLDDAPNGLTYREGQDLLQVLWSPRDHGTVGPKVQVFWRTQADCIPGPEVSTRDAFPSYVPVPCRVFPERVLELPDWSLIPAGTEVRSRLEAWRGPEYYARVRTAAVGNKLGGYPTVPDTPPPTCYRCKRGMDFLLAITGDDWGGRAESAPREECTGQLIPGYAQSLGLRLPGRGIMNIYVCRRCTDWPIATSF